MSNTYLDIAMQKVIRQEVNKELEDIKAEIRQKQWHIGVDSANQVIEIINNHISRKENIYGTT